MTARHVILFIPVSSASGIGEYMRCRIIADALASSRTDCDIHFILSREAPYKDDLPYLVHLVDRSPTLETDAVKQVLENLRPDIALFDCSGRAEQYRHARKLGARVVFVSQHRKKRARGFSLRRIAHIDQHWIVQFRFVDGELSWYERLKQQLLGHREPMFIGAVFDDSQLQHGSMQKDSYILFSAGGGGYQLHGKNAADHFYDVACNVYGQTGIHCVLVLGANYQGDAGSCEGVTCIGSVPNHEMMALAYNAHWLVIGGGDLMSQAVSLGKAVIAVVVAKDQVERINAFADRGLVIKSDSDFSTLAGTSAYVCVDDVLKQQQLTNIEHENIKNGLYLALQSIDELLQGSTR